MKNHALRTAIVTGASRGIGNAIAAQLAQDGCAVVIVDIFDEGQVAENLEKIKSATENSNEECQDSIHRRFSGVKQSRFKRICAVL